MADYVEKLLPLLVVPPDIIATAKRHDPQEARPNGSKGKPPGTLNMSWRGHFAMIAEVCGREAFPLGLVQNVLRERTQRDVKLSALRRQFKDYAKHGHVEDIGGDTFRLTDKLVALIGYQDSGEVRNENGPPEGGPDAGGVAAPSSDDRARLAALLD